MNKPDYSYDLPVSYHSWIEFDTDIEQHIARPDQVQDVYWYLAAEGVNVITMGELPDHQQLRYERQYVRRMARKERRKETATQAAPTLTEGLPPDIRSWTELLASFGQQHMNKYWVGARIHQSNNDPTPKAYYYTYDQIMQHVAEERKVAEVEPFTEDEAQLLMGLLQIHIGQSIAPGDTYKALDRKLLQLIWNAREARRIERLYPQQIIDGRR